jgi:hypothetical protein
MDSFSARADQLSNILRQMEQSAEDDQLFALGYMIPQLTLVAEYVEPEDSFDACFTQWLYQVFDDDNLTSEDQQEIIGLWQEALRLAG